jgi:hypothetical protein
MMVVLAACVVPAACSTDGATDVLPTGVSTTISPPIDTTVPAPNTTAPVTSPTTDSTSTTVAPTTPSTTPPEDVDLLALYENATPAIADDAPCELAWSELASATGEVTFARHGDLFSYDPTTGALHCLAHVDHDPRALDWNPAGNRLLVDEDLVVTAGGRHPSGFAPGTTGISWSQPAGTALIAPNADGSALRHVNANDPSQETDVASLATTWAAAYHPSGFAIVSAGIDRDGNAGLFLADNTGGQLQQLVFLEDASTTITEVAFAHNGNWVTFVHDHTNGSTGEGVMAHIHRFQFEGFALEDVASLPDVVPSGLVASEQADGTVAWQQPYSTISAPTFTWSGGQPRQIGFPETIADPVGFFDGGSAAAVVVPVGTQGVGQLWVFPRAGDPLLIARDVTAAATRTVHHPVWSEPPLRIDQQAVG